MSSRRSRTRRPASRQRSRNSVSLVARAAASRTVRCSDSRAVSKCPCRSAFASSPVVGARSGPAGTTGPGPSGFRRRGRRCACGGCRRGSGAGVRPDGRGSPGCGCGCGRVRGGPRSIGRRARRHVRRHPRRGPSRPRPRPTRCRSGDGRRGRYEPRRATHARPDEPARASTGVLRRRASAPSEVAWGSRAGQGTWGSQAATTPSRRRWQTPTGGCTPNAPKPG